MRTDLTSRRSKLKRTARAARHVRESLSAASREIGGCSAAVRDIDQFTARQACTVLAALRLLQVIQCQGGELPSEISSFISCFNPTPVIRLTDMEHFETEPPLNLTELDDLCERIEVDFSR